MGRIEEKKNHPRTRVATNIHAIPTQVRRPNWQTHASQDIHLPLLSIWGVNPHYVIGNDIACQECLKSTSTCVGNDDEDKEEELKEKED